MSWELPSDEHFEVGLNLLFLVLVLLACFVLQHYIIQKKWAFLPSSVATILVSAVTGSLLRFLSEYARHGHSSSSSSEGTGANTFDSSWMLTFSANTFYFALLPCIIFNAGYHIHRTAFFRNWFAILSLAIVGTWTCILLLAMFIFLSMRLKWMVGSLALTWMESLAFSALLASTDPVCTLAIFSALQVDVDLFYLVLGESMLNDAVALTVFRAASDLSAGGSALDIGLWAVNMCIVFMLSSAMGYAVGVLAAVMGKQFDFTVDEVTPIVSIMGLAYLSFYLAEVTHLSGIVAVFFAGMAVRRYFVTNTLRSTCEAAASLCIETIGYGAEVASMVIMGMSLVLVPFTQVHVVFTIFLFLACMAIRALQSYGLLTMVNGCRIIAAWWNGEQIYVPVTTHTVPTVATTEPDQTMGSAKMSRSPLHVTTQHLEDVESAVPVTTRRLNVRLIPLQQMHIVWLAGLRGALNYSLATLFPDTHGHRDGVMATTAVVILLSVCLLGGATMPTMQRLGLITNRPVDTNTPAEEKPEWEIRYLDSWVLRNLPGSPSSQRSSVHTPAFAGSRSACCYAANLEDVEEDDDSDTEGFVQSPDRRHRK